MSHRVRRPRCRFSTMKRLREAGHGTRVLLHVKQQSMPAALKRVRHVRKTSPTIITGSSAVDMDAMVIPTIASHAPARAPTTPMTSSTGAAATAEYQ